MSIQTLTINYTMPKNKMLIVTKMNLPYSAGISYNMPISILKQITPTYHSIIECTCDICHQSFTRLFQSISLNEINKNYILCVKCKIEQTMLSKYGVKNASQSSIVKNKKIQTTLKHYGVENPFQAEDIKTKIKCTCLQRYGTEYASQSEQFRQKVINTIQQKYGSQYVAAAQVPVIRQKQIDTLRSHGNNIPTSRPQKYLCDIVNGELNYHVLPYTLDIAFIDEKIYIEYNGGGHKLDILLHGISEEKFNEREIHRIKYLFNFGWKGIIIISHNDYWFYRKNRNNNILLLLLRCKQYLLSNNISHIQIFIEKQIIVINNDVMTITGFMHMN